MKNIIRIIILTVGLHSIHAQTVLEQSIAANTPYLGQYATVNLTIDDANGDNEITHPLIVAEGFDLGVVIAPENENGYQDYRDFQRTVLNSSSFDLQNLILNSGKDYDIIYVDWDNGVDYLQRNAYALEAVIEWVNSVKLGTEQNVILGQSMGGVIARWALADMEERSLNHDTSLFISHDAPQQGANIPASLQFMYRHGGNQYVQTGQTLGGAIVTVPVLEITVGVSNYLSLLDTPATKQLLKNTATTSYAMVDADHTTFYNSLKNKGLSGSNGYPINCRNIALSNGSECGNTQDFNPGDHLVNYQWNKGLSFWGDLASLVYNPLGGVLGGLFIDSDLFGVAALGLIPGHSRYNVDFQAKAIPYGSGNQIYKGLISYTKKILWFIPVTINITNVQKNQPTGILPFDTYGGGFYNVNQFIDTSSLPSGAFIRDRFSFISTASSIDIGENSVTLNDADYLKSYVGASPPSSPKNSPFDNYSTEFDSANPNAGNYGHISFNTRNGDWLAAEMIGTSIQTTDCSFICNNTKISGNTSICTSGSYSVNSGASIYNWSITEGSYLVNLSGNGTPNITITKSGSASGYVTMQVTLGDNSPTCGNITLTKRIFVGTEVIDSIFFENGIYEEGYFCSSHNGNTFEIYPDISGNTYQYRLLSFPSLNVLYTSSILSGNSGTIYYTPSPGWYIFEARTTNSCGTSDWFGSEVEYVDCSNGGGGGEEGEFRFAVFPNPSSEEVNISYKSKNSLSDVNVQSDNISRLRLYDFSGNIIIEKNNGSLKKLNISRAKKGLYFLEVTSGENSEMHKVVVEK